MSLNEINCVEVFAAALNKYLNDISCSDYKICLLVGNMENVKTYGNSFVCCVENTNEWRDIVSDSNAKNIKTISLSCNKGLVGTTVPELDCFVWLRNISSAESYDQFSDRINNPFQTETSSKQNVLVWIWNKDLLFKLAAYTTGLIKNVSKTITTKNFDACTLDELLTYNIILPNIKTGEYICQ